MSPEIELTSRASSDLRHLDPSVVRRVIDKLQWLADNSHIVRHEPLRGDWEHVFKPRVGAYRVLYSIEGDQRLVVHFVRHRREVYRRP